MLNWYTDYWLVLYCKLLTHSQSQNTFHKTVKWSFYYISLTQFSLTTSDTYFLLPAPVLAPPLALVATLAGAVAGRAAAGLGRVAMLVVLALLGLGAAFLGAPAEMLY